MVNLKFVDTQKIIIYQTAGEHKSTNETIKNEKAIIFLQEKKRYKRNFIEHSFASTRAVLLNEIPWL